MEGLDEPDVGRVVDHLLGDESADDGIGVGGDGEEVIDVVGLRGDYATGVGNVAVEFAELIFVDGPGQGYGEHVGWASSKRL